MSHDAASEAQLKQLPDWEVKDGKLHRQFKFADFAAAIKFMDGVFAAAEQLNHHPEIYNVYNQVTIDLWTHETGAISQHDLELAQAINAL